MKRRSFVKRSAAGAAAALVGILSNAEASPVKKESDREYWIRLLGKIADPMLGLMSRGELRQKMRVDYSPTYDKRDRRVAYLEAFGRLVSGLAEVVKLDGGAEFTRWREQTRASIAHGFDPKSPDYLYYGDEKQRQPLVDAAFLASGLLSAPEVLWEPLNSETKENIVREFTTIRRIQPFNNNWVLFAAMIETFLLSIGEKIDEKRIDGAIDTITRWYVGDGWYKDGEHFAFDHYNGYVIQPMLCQVLKVNSEMGRRDKAEFEIAYKRMRRYASFQERYISPEGTYPVVGRSSTYRVGLFWPLAKLALDGHLPDGISPAQVRCGLTAVFKRVFADSTFTKEGWLTLGLVGDRQRDLADSYSNTGSMYMVSLAFLPLGLPASHEFWSGPYTEWTQLKAWSGKPFPRDYHVAY
ncbi:MAG TPA: DUF2264 domain-containing protein [Pyrinomonadaceae bacterium]|nr:DUF2264 domain-containing protein [Pyrinomonadaceae bacterium]